MSSLLDELEFTEGKDLRDGAHVAFHALVVEPAASTWDWRVLDVLWRASERYLAIVIGKIRVQEGPSGIRNRHLAILEAASAGSPEQLRSAVIEHLDSGVQILGELLGDALGGEPARS
jgi:DNA-binding GntR family transcriptional regulator